MITASPAVPAAANQASQRCAFTTLVGVRGSTEPAGSGSANGGRTYASGGLGSVVGALAYSATIDRDLPFWVEGINYPAVISDPANASAPTYTSSWQAGMRKLFDEIENLALVCPMTNIVLAGYSQGAHVIDGVLNGQIGLLSQNARNHISAVVMYGSPAYHAGDPWNAPGSGTSNGILGSASSVNLSLYQRLAYVPPSYALQAQSVIRSYCLTGDAFCQANLTPAGMDIHESYKTTSVVDDSWTFVRAWLTDNN
ncbi:Cutinase [Leifsonia sp. 21MFCrub1.1]|nr:Cutinase [Leifsonia sp. 21MFCrub1.1]